MFLANKPQHTPMPRFVADVAARSVIQIRVSHALLQMRDSSCQIARVPTSADTLAVEAQQGFTTDDRNNV
jgi:hypothetical protein